MDTELFGIFKRKPNKAKGNESTSGFKPQILNKSMVRMSINIRMLKMVQKAACGQKGKRITQTNLTCLAVDRLKIPMVTPLCNKTQ